MRKARLTALSFKMMITILIVLPCRSSSELLAVSVRSTLLWTEVLKIKEYLDKSWCQRAQITLQTTSLIVFFIIVKGSKGTLYITLAGGRKIMATVGAIMVVRARATLTGTILQRAYYSGEQCFSRNLNHDNVALLCNCALMKPQIKRVCLSCHKCELATY